MRISLLRFPGTKSFIASIHSTDGSNLVVSLSKSAILKFPKNSARSPRARCNNKIEKQADSFTWSGKKSNKSV